VIKGPKRIIGAARRLGLLGLIATILAPLLGFLAPPASATPLLQPQTRVAAIEHPAGQIVGPHSSVLAGEGRERAPTYDGSATGSSVAAEGESSLGASDGVNVVESSGRTFVSTPRGTVYDIPEGWVGRTADNGQGIVFQEPGAAGNADSIRIMDPTTQYSDGYVRYYNDQGQPLDVNGNPGPASATHISQTYQGPWSGWP
jgi:hypothetical protein